MTSLRGLGLEQHRHHSNSFITIQFYVMRHLGHYPVCLRPCPNNLLREQINSRRTADLPMAHWTHRRQSSFIIGACLENVLDNALWTEIVPTPRTNWYISSEMSARSDTAMLTSWGSTSVGYSMDTRSHQVLLCTL